MQLRAAADGTHPSVSVRHRSFTRLTLTRDLAASSRMPEENGC